MTYTSSSNKRRYHQNKEVKYRNPFFPKRLRAHRTTVDYTLIQRTVVCLVVLAGIIIFLEQPWFRIRIVEIEGNRLVDSAVLKSSIQELLRGRRYLHIVPNDHWLLFRETMIREAATEQFPFKTVTFQRKLPDTLKVVVGERVPAILLEYPEHRLAIVDNEGFIVTREITTPSRQTTTSTKEGSVHTIEVTNTNDNKKDVHVTSTESVISSVAECTFCDTFSFLPLVYVSSTPPLLFEINRPTLPPLHITTLLHIVERFKEISIPIDYIQLSDSSLETVEIHASEGFVVWLDLSSDISAQIANVVTLIKEKYPHPPRVLKYIDVRYGDRLYYK